MKNKAVKLNPIKSKFITSIILVISALILTTPAMAYFGVGQPVIKKQKKSLPDQKIVPGVIIVKLRKSPALAKSNHPMSYSTLAQKIATNAIRDIVPVFKSKMTKGAEILDGIYYFKFAEQENPHQMAARFSADTNIEYAEVKRIHHITATPNDTYYLNQTYTSAISIEAAWDVTKGEQGEVVIAIVDGGTDWQHTDLQENIWLNLDEIAGNGIDDDNNGFIDDVHGWNFNTKSGDPTGLDTQPANRNHGTQTAGIASARTNNNTGVAGMSWNSRIMPICVADVSTEESSGDGNIGFGFEGIQYAVENGADIINCSWGSAGSPSQFEQDVITFAHANGALIVAAAGNANSNNDIIPFYPAQYRHVVSVGATSDKDDKVLSSNYGLSVDIFAPGQAVYSTLHGDNYGSNTGTSMAAPIVAGIAALVKTKNPDWSPAQIKEQLRQSADWVDFTSTAARDKLAKGRVNALTALTGTGLTAVRLTDLSFQDSGGNGIINEGETIDLQLSFTGLLGAAANLEIQFSSPNIELEITNPVGTIPAIGAGETVTLPFSFTVAPGTPDNTSLLFTTVITGTDYIDYEIIRFKVRPPVFFDHDNGNLVASITSCGNIGFTGYADENDINGYAFLENGTGFVFKGINTLYESGLLIGSSPTQISNSIRPIDTNRFYEFTTPNDTSISVDLMDGTYERGRVTLFDSLASNPVGIKIVQDSYIYYDEPFNDFIIIKYTLTNLNSTSIEDVFAGIFVDWDINGDAVDYARFSEDQNLGWVQNTLNSPEILSGTMLLNPEIGIGFNAINNAFINDGFTDQEKWGMLSSGIQARSLNDLDVSTMISAGPLNFAAGESKVVAFAMVAGESVNDLQINASNAQLLWNNNLIPTSDESAPTTTTSIFLNPVNSKYANITVISDKSLQSPPSVHLIKNADSTQIAMAPITGTTTGFMGNHEFSSTGIYQLMTAVQPKYGADTTTIRDFTLSTFSPSQSTVITSLNADELFLPQASLDHDSYILAENVVENSEQILNISPKLALNESGRLTMQIRPELFDKSQLISIFMHDGTAWEQLSTQIDNENRTATAFIQKLGQFKLGIGAPTHISQQIPEVISLAQNYPNPFNPKTRIEYSIPNRTQVNIIVYNALGQAIKSLFSGFQEGGTYTVEWDGTNENNIVMPSALYFYQLKTGKEILIKKMLLLR
ncbi:MAG: T9SS C-terminal target domain-containing protein [Calditrichaeota bacterium]|nr:MAG: T9SS C-terminal target domain-containing protein [Calditrichota bacterium]